MKRKLLLVLSFIIMIFSLTSCSNIKGKTDLEISGVRGYTDALIDGSKNEISFNVSSAVSEFDLSDIIIPSNITVNAYSDEAHSNSLGTVVTLSEGLNEFYITFTVKQSLGKETSINWKLNITKLKGISDKEVSSISIASIKNSYLVGSSFDPDAYIKVIYVDSTSENIKVDQSMISGFDSSTTGSKQLTISYGSKTITFDYIVYEGNNEITGIRVNDIRSEYKVGESLEDIEIKVIYKNGNYDIVKINASNVTGFDSKTIGEKVLTLNYCGYTCTTTVRVVLSGNTGISDENVKYFYCLVSSIGSGEAPTKENSSKFDKYQEEFEKMSADEKSNIRKTIESLLISNEQIEELKKIEVDFAPIFNDIYKIATESDSAEEMFENFLEYATLENTSKIKEILVDILNLTTEEQVKVLANRGSSSTYYYEIDYFNNGEIENITYEEFFELFKGNESYDFLVKSLTTLKTNNDSSITNVIKIGFILINDVLSMTDKEFNSLIKDAINGIINYNTDKRDELVESSEELYNVIQTLNNILKRFNEHGSLEKALNFVKEMMVNSSSSSIEQVMENETYSEMIDFVIEHFDWLTMFFDNTTLEDCEYYFDALSSAFDDMDQLKIAKAIVVASKNAKSIIDDIEASLPLKEKIKNFIDFASGDKDALDLFIEYVNKVSKIDVENISDNDMETIFTFTFISGSGESKSYLYVEYEYDNFYIGKLIVPFGITEDEFINFLNENMIVYYCTDKTSTVVELDKTNVRGYSLDKVGIYSFEIVVEDAVLKGYYLLATKDDVKVKLCLDDYSVKKVVSDYFFIYDLSQEGLYEYAYYKSSEGISSWNNSSAEYVLSNIKIKYEYENINLTSYSLDYVGVSLKSTDEGLTLGTINFMDILGNTIYIPAQFFVIDMENLSISEIKECNDSSYKELEDGNIAYYQIKGYDLDFDFEVKFAYGIREEYVYSYSQDIIITGYDEDTLGLQKVHVSNPYDDYEFDFYVYVLEEAEAKTPLDIKIDADALCEIPNTEDALSEYTFITHNLISGPNKSWGYDYLSLISILYQYYDKEVVVKFETDFVNDPTIIEEEFIGSICIYDEETSELMYKFENTYTFVDPEHYDDYDNEVYASTNKKGTLIVDSYDDVDADLMKSIISSGTLYYKYHYGYEDVTKEELLSHLENSGFSFEVEYFTSNNYRTYYLYVSKGEYRNNLFSVKVCEKEVAEIINSVNISYYYSTPALVDELSSMAIANYLSKYYYMRISHSAYDETITGEDLLDILKEQQFEFDYDAEEDYCYVTFNYQGIDVSFGIKYALTLEDYHLCESISFMTSNRETDPTVILQDYLKNVYKDYSLNRVYCYYGNDELYFYLRHYGNNIEVSNDYNWFALDIDYFIENVKAVAGQELVVNETNTIYYEFKGMVFSCDIKYYTLEKINEVYDIYVGVRRAYCKTGETITKDEIIDQCRCYIMDNNYDCPAYYFTKEEKDILFNMWDLTLNGNRITWTQIDEWYWDFDIVDESEKDTVLSIELNNDNEEVYCYFYGTLDDYTDLIKSNIKVVKYEVAQGYHLLYSRAAINEFLDSCTITYEIEDDIICAEITKDDVKANLYIYIG